MILSLALSAKEEVRECNSSRDGPLEKMPRKKSGKEESKEKNKNARGKGIWAPGIANITLKRA